jgi:hypothetical protein
MIEIVSCTAEDLADAFAEWQRRRPAGPGLFEAAPPLPPEEYGPACAPYFRELLVEAAEKSADPVRLALARGWTPPAPDYEPFWYHRDHGPVHQDDLAGVLAGDEAPEPDGPAPARPGTRMLEMPAATADPMRQAEESIERLRRERVDKDVAESAKRASMRKVLPEG